MAFRHHFPLAFAHVAGRPLFFYGAVYTIGFIGVFVWYWLRRQRIGFSRNDVYDLSIAMAAGCLIGGRIFDILVYEWGFYAAHPAQIPDLWRGGLASHGVMMGAFLGVALFASLRHKPLLATLDELAVPAAFLMAIGRVGNFIEGGVIGYPTTLPWGVIYPDLALPRHPVALYDGAKNLLTAVVLIGVLRRYPAGKGVATAAFLLLYAGLRFGVDFFRDYESAWGGIGKGQYFNLAMALLGLVLLVHFLRHPRAVPRPEAVADPSPGVLRPLAFAVLCLYPLGIPTSWTEQNIIEKRKAPEEVVLPLPDRPVFG